jgi:hypothetical protein
MVLDHDGDEASNFRIGAEGRAQLYRQRAAALRSQIDETTLPREREKLEAAAARFVELAVAEEQLAIRKGRLAAEARTFAANENEDSAAE